MVVVYGDTIQTIIMTLMGSPLLDCEQLKDGHNLSHLISRVIGTRSGKKLMSIDAERMKK